MVTSSLRSTSTKPSVVGKPTGAPKQQTSQKQKGKPPKIKKPVQSQITVLIVPDAALICEPPVPSPDKWNFVDFNTLLALLTNPPTITKCFADWEDRPNEVVFASPNKSPTEQEPSSSKIPVKDTPDDDPAKLTYLAVAQQPLSEEERVWRLTSVDDKGLPEKYNFIYELDIGVLVYADTESEANLLSSSPRKTTQPSKINEWMSNPKEI